MWPLGRQSPIGSLGKAAMEKRSGGQVQENRRRSTEERLTSAQDGPYPEVMPNGGSGVGFHGLDTGREF